MKDLESVFDDLGFILEFISEKIENFEGKNITYSDLQMIRMALEPLVDTVELHYLDKKRRAK